MPITKSSSQLVDEAMAQVRTYSVAQVRARLDDPATQIVDIRDIRELADGTVPGAVHAPRGMLEFWVDPDSLAAKALQDMGMTNVAHIEGGYTAWVDSGAPTETLEQQKARRQPKA